MDMKSQMKFYWIELAAHTGNGRMCRNEFVRVDDAEAIAGWRERFENRDVYASVCRFREPGRDSAYICDIFFDVDTGRDDLESARVNVLKICDLIAERWGFSSMSSFEIHFSGNKGFHVIVPACVFNPSASPWTMKTLKALACRLTKEGVEHIDLGVYDKSRVLRLPNSINSKSGLYKVPLEYEELRDLGMEYVMETAREPRDDDSMAVPELCPGAEQWFVEALAYIEKRAKKSRRCDKHIKRGWQMPPCIGRLEKTTLKDGIRHRAYLHLSRFYGKVGMHPDEARKRLHRLDGRNPIKTKSDIDRIVQYGQTHPGFPGCNEVTSRFCAKHKCFYARHRERK